MTTTHEPLPSRGGRLDRRGALGGLLVSGLALAAAGEARAEAVEGAVRPEDEAFMRMAIAEAAQGDKPFGALIVRDGEIVVRSRNLGRTTNDPTAHAEMLALRRFCDVHPAEAMKGATLYASGEPCAMCMSAIVWCGIGRVVFAAPIERMAAKLGQIMVPCTEDAARTPFARIEITGGLLADEAMALFD